MAAPLSSGPATAATGSSSGGGGAAPNAATPGWRTEGSGTVPNGGAIIQCACDPTDPNQRWTIHGSGQLNTNGDANADIANVGAGTCLDAKASDPGNGGAIIQWTCNGSDHFQQWN